jgi:hypothetical protein
MKQEPEFDPFENVSRLGISASVLSLTLEYSSREVATVWFMRFLAGFSCAFGGFLNICALSPPSILNLESTSTY